MYRKILVPMDYSACSKRALSLALKFVGENGGGVTVLYVNHVSVCFGSWLLAAGPMIWPPGFTINGEELLEDILSDVGCKTESVKARADIGYPVPTILNVAEEEEADLIVMGTRGLGRLSGLLLGSISRAVVEDAPCPVLLVK